MNKSGSGKQNQNSGPKPQLNNNNNNNLKRKRDDDVNKNNGPNPKKQKIDNNAQKNQQSPKPIQNAPKHTLNNNGPKVNSSDFKRTPSTAITQQKPQANQNIASRNETRGGNLFGSKRRAPIVPSFLANKTKSGSDPKKGSVTTNDNKKDQNKVLIYLYLL
jgi:hypothetical protein